MDKDIKREGIENKEREARKALSLLRNAYPKEEKGGALQIANTIYELYKNNDRDFAKQIMKYVTRVDWPNKKHDFIYRVEKEMKALGGPDFKSFIEAVKRERRGAIPVEIGGVTVKYENRSNTSVKISVSIWGNVIVERLADGRWRISSHSSTDKEPYIVSIGESPSCSCLDFVYRKNKVGGKCKHIYEAEAVKAAIEMASEL
jgi:predicted nucleic acid-binding Zn finger protein